MDDASWHHIDELFGQALEIDTDRRDAFLDQKCGGDQKLRHAVDRLLALEVEAASFLAEPIAFLPAGEGAETPGVLDNRRAGPYRLLRPLGHGGMGSVYLARREDDYRQDVAIKLIRQGLMREDVRRRFRNERQILARLEHPNIARLYDGGTTAEGFPYLVMERVEGRPIDRYCDRHRLTIRQRLVLFRRVCAAVGHAHHRGLVHCDLKPSNILVTDDGTPKLLDFGIAKLLRPDEADDLTLTRAGNRPVTPGYASPEQVSGKAITPASDVYSLGVILYQLLCGRTPFRATAHPHRSESPSHDQEPAQPSRRVLEPLEKDAGGLDSECLSQQRGTTPYQLARQLRGDLDAIVLKALREDPAERYATVDELARDVVRHLEVRPVSARRDLRRYRASRLLRRLILPPDVGRRRERLFWAAAFAGNLVVILALVAARPVWLTGETEAPLAGGPGAETPLDGGPSPPGSAGAKAESHLAEARAAYERSDYRPQLHAARRAIHTARAEGDDLSEARALVLEAQALDILGQPTEADEALQDACRIFDRLGDRLGLARATFALRNTMDSRRLPMSFEDALAVFREHGDQGGEALALIRLGKLVPAAELDRGEAMILEALTLAQGLGDLRLQAEAWSNLASLSFSREDLHLADERFAKAVRTAQASGDSRLEAGFMFNRASVRRWLGDLETHDALIEEAATIARRIDHRYLLAMALPQLARVRSRQGDDRIAMDLSEEAKEIAFEIGDWRLITLALEGLATALERRAEYGRALELRQRIFDINPDGEGTDRAELHVTSNLLRLGRAAEAEARLRALVEKYPIDDKSYEYTALAVRLNLAENVLAQGRDEQAHSLLVEVLPRVAAKDEVELHRLAARLAAATDATRGSSTLADLLIQEERDAVAKGDTVRALRIALDQGRLLWYSGDELGARERFEETRRRAAELGHGWLAGMAAREAEELARLRPAAR